MVGGDGRAGGCHCEKELWRWAGGIDARLRSWEGWAGRAAPYWKAAAHLHDAETAQGLSKGLEESLGRE